MNHFSQQLNMSHISQCKPLDAQGALAARDLSLSFQKI